MVAFTTVAMGGTGPEDLTDADERVLAFLRAHGAEYPALIASNTGLYVTLAERRCDFLEEAGYIETVDGTVYRLTALGDAHLTGELERDQSTQGVEGRLASD